MTIRWLLYILLVFLLVPIQAQDEYKVVTIDVQPDKVDLRPGQSYRFIARGFNRYYNEVIPFVAEWSCTGGSITQDGVYVAGNSDGLHSVTAVASRTGAQGSAVVIIKRNHTTSAPLPAFNQVARLAIFPDRVTLNQGQTIKFEVRGYNQYGQEIRLITPRWSVTGGSMGQDGSYTAGGAPGNYMVRAVDPSTGINVEASITIQGLRGVLSYIQIFPRDAKIGAYKEQRFFATGYDAAGNVVPVTPMWEANGGKIDHNGIYIAGNVPGTYYIKAVAQGGISSTAKIIIEDIEFVRVQVVPDRAVLSPGQVLKFQAKAFDRAGNLVPVAPLWSANGGIIQADGTYYAGNIPGKYNVTVTVGRMTMPNIPIEILPDINKPIRLEITPSEVSVAPKQQVQFFAKAYNQRGVEVKMPITWTARGGIMEPNGVYQAGTTFGKYLIEATGKDDLTAKAWVTIVQGPVARLEITPTEVTLRPGQNNQFFVTAYDSNGYKVACPMTWSATAGDISREGIYTAGQQPGQYTLQVTTENGVKAVAAITIVESHSPSIEKLFVPSPTRTDVLDTRFLQILRWDSKDDYDGKTRIRIQTRMVADDGHKVQLVLEKVEGFDHILSQIIVRKGQAFEFTGEYATGTVRALKLALWNSQGQKIYEFRRETN